jgi:hypothetical protein
LFNGVNFIYLTDTEMNHTYLTYIEMNYI